MKGKITLLTQALTNIFKPVTIDYPAGKWPGRKYSQIPPALRGKHQIDTEKCTGCGACSQCCSTGAIHITEENQKRIIAIFLGECSFCGECQRICPEQAITLTNQFELAYEAPKENSKAWIKIEKPLALCKNCQTPITTQDQIQKEIQRVLQNIKPENKQKIQQDIQTYIKLCPTCRRKLAYKLNIHTRKYY